MSKATEESAAGQGREEQRVLWDGCGGGEGKRETRGIVSEELVLCAEQRRGEERWGEKRGGGGRQAGGLERGARGRLY